MSTNAVINGLQRQATTVNKKVEEVKKGGFGIRQEIDKKLEIML